MKLRGIVLTGVMVAAGVVGVAAPANASVGTCDGYYPTSASFSAYCTGSAPSSFRAFVWCTNGSKKFGPWRYAGGGTRSIAYCSSGQEAEEAGIEIYA